MVRHIDTEALNSVATQLFKHQDFKLSVALQRVKSNVYRPGTLQTYFTGMRRFIATGDADLNRAPQAFYDLIRSYMNTHVAKLTPSEADKADTYTARGHNRRGGKVKVVKPAEKKVTKDPSKIQLSNETLEKIKKIPEKVHTVGLMVSGKNTSKIKVFKNEDVLEGYMEAYKEMDENNELTFDIVDVIYSKRV